MANTRVTTPVTDFNKSTSLPGLKIPSGDNSNQPAGAAAEQGMIRNDTEEIVDSSYSAIAHYNGTAWQYFAATESVDNPLFASQNFNTVLYDGDNATPRYVTGVGFAPDLVWIKNTNNSFFWHNLWDSIRGVYKGIFPNVTAIQDSYSSRGYLSDFKSDGFELTRGSTDAGNNNENGNEVVAWCFKAGGIINESADFNGSSSYIETDSGGTGLRTAIQSNPTSLSISLWVKTTQTSVGMLFSDGNRSATPAYGLNLVMLSGGFPYFEARPTTGADVTGTSTTSVNNGQWHHICYTFGTTASNIYVDGVQSAPFSVLNGIKNATRNFLIGLALNSNVPNDLPFTGQMNQFRIFTSELNQTQVTALYNETAADNSVLNYPQNAGCIAAYPLGENANGLDGLYNGAASNVTFGKPGYLTRNTEGTIESTVSANVAAGFSIVGYTGNGTAGSTVGHGLASTPEMVIVKSLTSTANQSWSVYHVETGPTKSITLELTNTPYTDIGYWNNTSPTSIDFTLGNYAVSNQNNANYIAYCWHSVAGYSKISSYVGNGNTTGVLEELGFEPAFLMFKCVTQPGNWIMIDNKRATSNPRTPHLRANTSGQDDPGANEYVDFTSTGFQPKGVSDYNNNSLGQTYIYMAFATS